MPQDKVLTGKRLQRLQNSKDSNIKRLKCLYYNNPYIDMLITPYIGYIQSHSTISKTTYVSVVGTSREDVVNKLCKELAKNRYSFIIHMDHDQLAKEVSIHYASTTKEERMKSINWVIAYNQEKNNSLNQIS